MEKEIKQILLEIIELLESVGECHWKNILKRLYTDNSYRKDWLREIKSIFGGMGSFTDLVLMRNNVVCMDENKKLDQLRERLYNRTVEYFIEVTHSERSE